MELVEYSKYGKKAIVNNQGNYYLVNIDKSLNFYKDLFEKKAVKIDEKEKDKLLASKAFKSNKKLLPLVYMTVFLIFVLLRDPNINKVVEPFFENMGYGASIFTIVILLVLSLGLGWAIDRKNEKIIYSCLEGPLVWDKKLVIDFDSKGQRGLYKFKMSMLLILYSFLLVMGIIGYIYKPNVLLMLGIFAMIFVVLDISLVIPFHAKLSIRRVN